MTVGGPTDISDWVGLVQMQLPPSRDDPYPELVSSALARRQAFFGPALRRSTPISLVSTASTLIAPVLIMEERRDQPSREAPTNGRELYAKLRKLGREAEYTQLGRLRIPDELSADRYRQIADFFTDRLFSYRVDVGEPTKLP